ncbi:MAG: hypothetical protein P8184_03660 [Calditrichia bacterium]
MKELTIKDIYTFLLVLFMMVVNGLAGDKNLQKTDYKQLTSEQRWELGSKQIKSLSKALQEDPRHEILKETIISGNQIRVLLTNQGSISTPNADNSNADLVWPKGPNSLGYAFEFGPLVGAEVTGKDGETLHIVDDGFILRADGDYEPGTDNKWGWEPKKGFSDPNSPALAHFSDLDENLDGKPDSWPENWYNAALGRYVWPAFLGDDATTPDEEVFYVMDDFDNAEYPYYPDPQDSTMRGLGLELQVRIFQFNNPLAEDLIFLVYTITNVSPKKLDKIYLGMFGDPHVGGANDYSDDDAGFISVWDRDKYPENTYNMVYAWDDNGVGDGKKIPGYFGYRFLESPGLDNDGIDNDNDGMLDESQFNDAGTQIFDPRLNKERWQGDEDGDWNPDFDDVGVDGIPGTGDYGEGDGKPTQLFYRDINGDGIFSTGEPYSESREQGMRFAGGEPNFGFLDIAESDQLGLTSFNALSYAGNNRPKNDDLMWSTISTNNLGPNDPPPNILQTADNVFIYGDGPFSLEPGESFRFSIALLLGENFNDLLQNAQISQQVFESDYRFAQPPRKPHLVAVPGDKKVTLYWDTGAEQSFDPFISRANPDDPHKGYDFEGYKIYRSQDYSFNDTKTITDSKGIAYLSEPLQTAGGLPAQFDLDNEYKGLAEVEYQGRGVRYDLGNNTGLSHVFVDSNNVKNGVTYFYSVSSYDHGDVAAVIPPSECTRTIQRNAVTREFTLDVNTAMVTPGGPAQGFISPELSSDPENSATLEEGDPTGKVWVEFLDPLKVIDGKKYSIVFDSVRVDSATIRTGYSVIDPEMHTSTFTSRDTVLVGFQGVSKVLEGSVTVKNSSGSIIDPSNYIINYDFGKIRGASPGALPAGEKFTITYQIKPVANSLSLNGGDDNPVFDGVKVFVQDDEVALDSLSTKGGKSGFKTIETNTNFSDEWTTLNVSELRDAAPYPADFEFRFTDYDTAADGRLINPADSSIKIGSLMVRTNFKIINSRTGERTDFFIQEKSTSGLANHRWDWPEEVTILKPGWTSLTQAVYTVKFTPPVLDTLKNKAGEDSIAYADPVYPGAGDVFYIFSYKNFDPGDKFSFTTKAAVFDKQIARNGLDDVIVVPDPYIAYSSAEQAGIQTGTRDDRRLEFRNLPEKCTIRIYTITGELVDTIEKNNRENFAIWDLLSFESQEIAYGVYIYHIDAPGVGTKIGRFAVIK